ncbi:2OG-Fe(II) oxygenase [Nocardia callitridis]|uniref:Uncharacterized protein n=1 Tax=Nocardia callitridis TaxID=648753 RepID=A0ABP9K2S3_9NOCA
MAIVVGSDLDRIGGIGNPKTLVTQAVSSVVFDSPERKQNRAEATSASALCRFRDVLGVAAADRMLAQIAVAGAKERPGLTVRSDSRTPTITALATVVGDLTDTVCDLLDVEPPAGPRLTFELVTGDDRDQLSTHTLPRDELRRVGFVYWLHTRPRRFYGGQLRIHDVGVRDGRPVVDAEYRDCPVEHDTIVFFPASAPTTLRPVTRPADLRPVNASPGDPTGSRFALRGWIS